MDAVGKLFGDAAKIRRQRPVGERMMAIAEVATARGGVAAELADVGYEQRGPAIGDNGLARLHFSCGEVEQRAVLVDAADTEDSDVGLEAGKETLRRIADDVAVERTQ